MVDELTDNEFDSLVGKVKSLEGIYDVRGNYNARKLFIEFNELQTGETKLYSEIKKFGYNIE